MPYQIYNINAKIHSPSEVEPKIGIDKPTSPRVIKLVDRA